MSRLRVNQAITQALADEMRFDPSVILMGEDVADAEGPFKTSVGLLSEFGPLRVRDTPISEMGFLGAAVGAAVAGLRPVVEIMFVEFLGVALDQLVTEAAKVHYLSGGKLACPIVVRASVGAGAGFGCQHSQTLENWLVATPGLKVCVASGARTAYGLLRAAIRDDNPVVVLEPRVLYGAREECPTGESAVLPLGVAEVLTSGSDVTVVALGQMVGVALEAAEKSSVSMEVLDLRTLVPWDRERVLESVSKTGRLVTVEESPASWGWGTEIASYVGSHLFRELHDPVHRITTPDAPVPFTRRLEGRFVPTADYVVDQVESLMANGATPSPWWLSEESA